MTPTAPELAGPRRLTAVERFSALHDAGEVGSPSHRYRDLVPLSRPGPGRQYGFEVDLDACTGCKACVTACRSLNGLDDGESWRSVGLLTGGGRQPFAQTVTAACHHCVEPACLAGCPVDAYEKDPLTGIVKHLDDQCIGCSYCTLTCPYEVPVFNEARGIVRKCDMCSDRLAAGEPPACVQACPNGAIRIRIVETAEMRERAAALDFLPGAPDPRITVPTTTYVTRRPELSDALAADHFRLRPAPAHRPLAVMLVLTQLSVGAFVADLALRALAAPSLVDRLHIGNALSALALGLLALAASVGHLGRPRYAFRAVIGVRHSWLSREVLTFGAFAALGVPYALALWRDPGGARPLTAALGVLVALLGTAGVACSVMIYAVTRRVWWRAASTGFKFAMTSVVCGLGAVLAGSLATSALVGADAHRTLTQLGRPLGALLAVSAMAKLAVEAGIFGHVLDRDDTDLKRTALLLARDLRVVTAWRFATGLVGGVGVPMTLLFVAGAPSPPAVPAAALAAAGLLAIVTGELLERSLYFRAVAPPRMPGGLG